MTRRCALIAGVSGVVGRGLAKYIVAQGDWDVIGMARRAPSPQLEFPVIELDLTDAAACRAQAHALSRVTHVFYCVRAAHTASAKEPIDVNLGMLRNLIDVLEPAAPALAHVHLVQGSKYYGSDLGPYKTPARESDPRITDPNGYYAQEDFIIERSRNTAWRWSACRPHAICDG